MYVKQKYITQRPYKSVNSKTGRVKIMSPTSIKRFPTCRSGIEKSPACQIQCGVCGYQINIMDVTWGLRYYREFLMRHMILILRRRQYPLFILLIPSTSRLFSHYHSGKLFKAHFWHPCYFPSSTVIKSL